MKVRLRHIKGKNLTALEKILEQLKFAFVITNVNFVNGYWYIHFLVQSQVQDVRSDFQVSTATNKLS